MDEGVGPGSASVTLASEAQRAQTPPLLPLPTLDRLMEADKLKELSTVEKVVPGVEPLAASAVEKPAAAAAVADTSAAAAKRLIGPLVDYESDSEEEDGGSADEES